MTPEYDERADASSRGDQVVEKRIIEWLSQQFGATKFAKIGIGDDCAVLPAIDGELVLTCDAICDGVHFLSDELTAEQIGRKALAVNLSDLASMGATAKAAIVSMTLPKSFSFPQVQQLFHGMRTLAEQFDVEICGGDTTVWDGKLVVSVTAMGVAPAVGAWQMSGAKPGDEILVTGQFGGSILKQHWACQPRLDFAKQFAALDLVEACTDVSDSLGLDLASVANASSVGFEIHANAIPVSNDAHRLAERSGKSALQHALCDGEDFELILAVKPQHVPSLIQQANIPLTSIGHFTNEPEYWIVQDGQRSKFEPDGYEHKLEN